MKYVEAQMWYFVARAVVRSLHAIAYAIQDSTNTKSKGVTECIDVSNRHLQFAAECLECVGQDDKDAPDAPHD